MSGGVDSSVAAALLKERNFDVTGIHIKIWSDPDLPCTAKEDRLDAMRVAAKLNIPFETWDFAQEYRAEVVDYMIKEYAAGRTPNPDVMCNRHIKFGAFLRRALERGADFVATGHYTKIQNSKIKNQNDKSKFKNIYKLLQAKDKNKDQSYFLWTLTQNQLKHCLFPIGEYTKTEVRAIAKKLDLPTADKPDSQGVCFIGEFDMAEFLKKYIPQRKGRVLTTSGKVAGEHSGVEFYTIGQREGLHIGGGIPYYVTEKNTATNTLVVAEGPYDEKLFQGELVASDANWISGSPPRIPFTCEARIRYRQPLQSCRVYEFNEFRRSATHQLINSPTHQLRVVFDEPQRAVTPGQSVVFYKDSEMLGGAIIA